MSLDSPGAGSLAAAGGAPTGPLFPAQNADGQRICRQCGQPGRYKDGKCVEKWGPGPAGPGTVCDRCRKKMKRVERRGTLETLAQAQQLAAQASSLSSAIHQSQSQSQSQSQIQSQTQGGSEKGLQRTDTLPANASAGGKKEKASLVRTLISNSVTSSGKDNRRSPLPPHLQHSLNNNATPPPPQTSTTTMVAQIQTSSNNHSLQERARQELQSLQQQQQQLKSGGDAD
ncbi:hypothetical protein FA13DRAFT_1405771 [Coprinellus micaceus]|uniref:Uncharacterized protein n=1 Tax=Coprinellus micaceus TaxID=71717 RepID=A0A4Y7SP54_COPMI|nr:hypothetical protein FA13DRAFT_1405771 [Coprinellus micaceus]